MNHIKKHAPKQITSSAHYILLLILNVIIAIPLSPLPLHAAYDPHYDNKTQKTDDAHKTATQKLFIAIKNDNCLLARQAINERANVNAIHRVDGTPLTVAVGHNRPDLLQILLNHTANPNTASYGLSSPLIIAATYDFSECARLLVTHKADINERKTISCDSPLIIALQNNNTKTAKILIEHKASTDEIILNGSTALMLAAHIGCIDTVKLLLKHKANVNSQIKTGHNTGCTALITAVGKNHPSIIETLIIHGANTTVNLSCNTTYNTSNTVTNAIAKRKSLEKELGKQNWDLETSSPLHIIERFTIPALALIIGDYADPYHPSNQQLHDDIRYYIQNNLGYIPPSNFSLATCFLHG